MNRDEFREYINSLGHDFDSTGGVTEKQIEEFEEKLGFKIPECYRWYLEEYGSGGVGGAEVLGIGFGNFNSSLEVIDGNDDFPKGLIPILFHDEYYSCLDSSTSKDDNCMVVMWGIDDNKIDETGESFYDYLYRKFNVMLGV